MFGWRERATTSPDKIREMASNRYAGHNWVSVAKDGFAIIIDVDDVAAAKELGMPIPEDTFIVRTPKNGLHIYLWHTAESNECRNWDVKKDGNLIVEFKANNKTCASPGVFRNDKEPHGWYQPINDNQIQPIRKEMVEWIKAHKIQRDGTGFLPPEYHETFDRADWLEHYKLNPTGKEKIVGEVPFVELGFCPFVGRQHTGGGEGSFCTCITFGHRIGISCRGCLDKHIQDFYVLCEEDGIEDYPYCIYASDDPARELESLRKAFDFEDADSSASESNWHTSLGPVGSGPTPCNITSGYMNVGDLADIKCTDMGNGKRLARLCGHEIAFVRETKAWHVWDGKVWKEDKGEIDVTRKAKAVVKSIFMEAANEPDEDKATDLVKWALRSQSKERIDAMIKMARSEGTIAKSVLDFDNDEHLYNCDNGVVDLHTGELLPHDPRHMMSQISHRNFLGVDVDIFRSEFWKFFTWAQPQEEVRSFLHRAFGYSMWGTAREHAIIFLWGADGNNGKGVMLNLLNKLNGDYSKPADFKTFSENHRGGGTGGHSDEIAHLHKKRSTFIDETNKGGRINEGLLKMATGGTRLHASFKGKTGFDFDPIFTLWFASNHKPKLSDTGKPMRRRLKFVKFLNSVELGKEDAGLPDRLIKDEGDLIFSWMVKGAVEWNKRGLDTPQEISDWTDEYFAGEDYIQHWLNECVESGVNYESGAKDTYLSFAHFCEENNYFKLDAREFKKRMEQKGFTQKKTKMGNKWVGFKVVRHFFDEEPKITDDMIDAVM